MPDEEAPPSRAKVGKEPGPGGAGTEEVDDHRVSVPNGAKVFEISFRRLEKTFSGRVQIDGAALREELLIEPVPEQAVAADKEKLAHAGTVSVAFQAQTREYQ